MPKTFLQDESPIWRITFYEDEERTTPVNPVTVDFFLKRPDGTVVEPTVTATGPTGEFETTFVVDMYGRWKYRWKTETPRIIAQGEIEVIEQNVPD